MANSNKLDIEKGSKGGLLLSKRLQKITLSKAEILDILSQVLNLGVVSEHEFSHELIMHGIRKKNRKNNIPGKRKKGNEGSYLKLRGM